LLSDKELAVWQTMLNQRWSRSYEYIEHNLIKFIQVLRCLGLRVSSSEAVDLLKALLLIDLSDKVAFKTALQAVLVKDIEKKILFEKAFAIFFATPEEKDKNFLEGLQRKEEREKQNQQIEKDFTFQREDGSEKVQFDLTEMQKQIYNRLSSHEQEKLCDFVDQVVQTHREGNFTKKVSFLKNFITGTLNYWEKQLRQNSQYDNAQVAFEMDLTGEEKLDEMLQNIEEQLKTSEQMLLYEDMKTIGEKDLPKAMVIIKRLAKKIASRISRRYKQSKKSKKIEIRRTIRSNIGYGGTMLELKYKARKMEKPKVILICDVSGSMSRYASFVLQFMYGLSSVVREMESFIFADDLQRVTEEFRKQRSFEDTMIFIMQSSPYWGGGTNLQKALNSFAEKYQQLLTSNSRIIIMSDAKTSNPQETASSLEKTRKKVKDILWLNTLPKSEWIALEHLSIFQKNCRMFSCQTLAHLEEVMKYHFLSF